MTKHRFELAAEEDTTRVELFGEISDWRNAIPLDRSEDGSFARTLELPTGVYQYKLLVRRLFEDAEWTLDPNEPRTRSEKGQANNIVVVDGAPEPWLFAAAPPWIVELDRGGARILVGMRRGTSSTSTSTSHRISWSEDDGATWSSKRLEPAFEEDQHAFFIATIPTSAASIRLALESSIPGAVRYEARWSRPPVSSRPPIWWKRAILYGIFVDRFRPAADLPGWERDPGKRASAGGHLDGIRRSLDELLDLGVDTLYLTPVHVGATMAHRYDLVDPLRVDPELGGDAAYEALVRAAHTRGMRIIQDISFAHAGRGFPPWEDVLINGERSRYASWFVWRDGKIAHYGKRTDAPLLDQTNDAVQRLALDAVTFWAKRGVDGLRLDMTAEVPLELGRKIRKRLRELVPDGVVLGELVPEHAWRWRNEGVIDAATDFGFHEIVTELTCATDVELDAAAAYKKLARVDLLRGGDPRIHSVRFLSTHDHTRLASLAFAKNTTHRLPLAYTLLTTMPGIPMLLYGEELGLRSAQPERDPEDVWPDRMPMPWNPELRDPVMRSTLRALLRARRDSEALRGGSLSLLFADATTLVYRREVEREIVDIAINFSHEPKTIELEDDEYPRLDAIVSVNGALTAHNASMSLPGHSAMIAKRERALGRAVPPVLVRRNLVLRDRDLVVGAPVATARPSRFFFSVTERCNLRCEHCITHAPERTRNGTARTMTKTVLDALAKDLGYGDYFAFVHGGESLTAPILFDVLDAIGAARGPTPWVAHLLTNGVLLDLKMAERLVRAGVSSISFSLDGATAPVNDGIRVGGRFLDVRENLKRLMAWRVAEGIDLRVGISCVVMRQNIHELDALVELGADLGVDWIKLEEGVPATTFAKRSLVSMTTMSAREAVDRAIALGRTRGLVMVDHTEDRPLFRCRIFREESGGAVPPDEHLRAFMEADELANRCLMHPCRTPWDTACIEPNGDVRAMDFFGPILGNVVDRPLVELWNVVEAQDLRREASLSRPCAPAGPVTCISGLV